MYIESGCAALRKNSSIVFSMRRVHKNKRKAFDLAPIEGTRKEKLKTVASEVQKLVEVQKPGLFKVELIGSKIRISKINPPGA
jgi:hypothetical protein